MAAASGALRAPALASPLSRFRGRGAQVAVVVAVWVIIFFLLRNDYPWPLSLVWEELPREIDKAQDWLLEQRTEGSNPFFALLDAFRAFADWLVTAMVNLLEWMTWLGTMAARTLIVWRFGGRRGGLTPPGPVISFALMGLWEPAIQTLALMFAAGGLSPFVGGPVGVLAGGKG